MALNGESREVVEEMKRYTRNVKRKGINEDYYSLKCHQAYAMYEVLKECKVEAMNVIFNYGFAKGIQAERNRLKKAGKGEN